MKLRDEKLIDPVKPLVSYLSNADLPDDPRSKQITARHALSHTTGLQNWRFRKDDKLSFASAPGERFGYTGESYFLLQIISGIGATTETSKLSRSAIPRAGSAASCSPTLRSATRSGSALSRRRQGATMRHFCSGWFKNGTAQGAVATWCLAADYLRWGR